MVRRFQLGANVFEVDVRGSELLVGIGKLNRPALKSRPQGSEAAARAEMEKLIAAHLARGYLEVDVPPDPEIARAKLRAQQAADDAVVKRIEQHRAEQQRAVADKLQRAAYTPARNAALEADDPRVYADWLIERGDPRGTIAASFLGGDPAAAIRLCTDYTPYGTIDLERGFAYAARVGGDHLEERVRALCSAGVACTLRELRIGLADDGNWTPIIDAIAASPLAGQIRKLELDASDRLDRDPQEADEAAEELYERVAPVRFAGAPRWNDLTALESVSIDGPFRGQLAMASASLRELAIRSNALYGITELLALRVAAPKLERLALYSPTIDDAGLRELRRVFGDRLVTTGDTRPPARYGAIVE